MGFQLRLIDICKNKFVLFEKFLKLPFFEHMQSKFEKEQIFPIIISLGGWAALEGWVVFGGWVAKLVLRARLLRQHSKFKFKHPSKIINGRHKQRSASTLWLAKNMQKKICLGYQKTHNFMLVPIR